MRPNHKFGDLKLKIVPLKAGEILEFSTFGEARTAQVSASGMQIPASMHTLKKKSGYRNQPAILVILRSDSDTLSKLYRDLMKGKRAAFIPGRIYGRKARTGAAMVKRHAKRKGLYSAIHQLNRHEPEGASIVVILRSKDDTLAALYRDRVKKTP